MPLIIVAIGVVLLILLITLFKMNTFVSLIITSFLVAIMLRLPVMSLPELIEKGLGEQFTTIAIVFCFGAMLGKLLSDSGGDYRIANTLIQKFGRRYIEIAVILTSFIVGLALFFEVGLVVLLPIIYVIVNEADMPLAMLGFPMAATLNLTTASTTASSCHGRFRFFKSTVRPGYYSGLNCCDTYYYYCGTGL